MEKRLPQMYYIKMKITVYSYSLQFLEVIWSVPKNFAFFQKLLDNFFYKFDNPEINCQEILTASFKNIEIREDFYIGPQI